MLLIKNRRGQTTYLLFLLIFIAFIGVIFIFLGGEVSKRINTALDQDIAVGQVNLSNINEQTFGRYNTMYINNADWWGIALIFGTVLGLWLSSFFLRGRFPKWGIILDIFILLAAFITSIYIANTYQILVDAFQTAGLTFMEDSTPKTAMFILNLPIFTVIIVVVSMICR